MTTMGFAVVYGDRLSAHLPGREWDSMLAEYCAGKRSRMPAGIGELDYHADRDIDAILTVLRAPSRQLADIQSALVQGHSYAVSGPLACGLRLTEVAFRCAGQSASLGEALVTDGPAVELRLSGNWQGTSAFAMTYPGQLTVVLNGRQVDQHPVPAGPFFHSTPLPLGHDARLA